MREIKFRGKCICDGKHVLVDKKWAFGSLVTYNDGPRIFTQDPVTDEITSEAVLSYTVGQFTGLKDSHGRAIYEGDIIESFASGGEPIIHAIGYDVKEARFSAYNEYTNCGVFQGWIDEFEKEVIGNIYDNPELMKRKNK